MTTITKHSSTRWASALLCLLVLTLSAVAQESRGTIIGRVADASDAVVPGAKVEIKNTSTNVTTTATTNSAIRGITQCNRRSKNVLPKA